jgi:hypothetical protein
MATASMRDHASTLPPAPKVPVKESLICALYTVKHRDAAREKGGPLIISDIERSY